MSHAPLGIRAVEAGRGRPEQSFVRPAMLLEALGRRKLTILSMGLLAALGVGLVGVVMPRTYTSTTQLLLDPRGLRVLEKDITPQSREPDQSVSVVESEMRFVVSDLVLNRVIDKLGLAEGSALGGNESQTAHRFAAWVVPIQKALEEARRTAKALLGRGDDAQMTPEQEALIALQKAVRVSRQPNTYVIDVEVKTKDREFSARVADTIASEYIAARFTSRGKASQRASESINSRLEELARQVREADSAVERYKANNDLVSAQGRLLTERRMAELSTQLQIARSETVRAEARLAQVRAVRRAGGGLDGSIEALQSPTLERLRSNYALVRQREASLSAQLLPQHPVIRQVRQEVRAAERSVAQEIERIAGTATAALQRARSTEKALEAQLGELKIQALGENRALVELRELERVAEASRSIYQTFLTRSRELSEQQRIDPNSAVVLAQAEPARAPNGPGLVPLTLAAGIGGLGLGAAFALRRDRRDPVVRSLLQVETLIDGRPLLSMPLPRRSLAGGKADGVAKYEPAGESSATAAASDRLVRALTVSSPQRGPLVCLVTAGEAGQGKQLVALNLAMAASRSGETVLLVDGDRDWRVATRAADALDHGGLAEVVAGTMPCATAIVHREQPPFDLMPSGQVTATSPPRAKLEHLSETLLGPLSGYDLVVIDGGVAGRDKLTAALAGRVDAVVMAVRLGYGQKSAVREAADWLDATSDAPLHLVVVQG